MFKNLTDGDIVVLLHDMARKTNDNLMRHIADRFNELSKEVKDKNVLHCQAE